MKVKIQKKAKKNSFKERDEDHIKGKIRYRLRRQLELEGNKEVVEYKKDKNDTTEI